MSQQFQWLVKASLPLLLMLLLICYCSQDVLAATNKLKHSKQIEQDLRSLQQLIDETSSGGILQLEPGEYNGSIHIDKPLTIIGTADVKLNIEEGNEEIKIASNDVMLSSLEIKDNRKAPQTAVIMATGDSLRLEQLNITTRGTGIAIDGASKGKIEGNSISWSGKPSEKLTSRGNGIQLNNVNDMSIAGNEIDGAYDGIYTENTSNLMITNNNVQNSRYAYHMMYGSNIQLLNNTSIANVTGMMLMASKELIVRDNALEKQDINVNAQGLLLYDATDVLVERNSIASSRVGIYVELSSQIRIRENNIHHNFVALQLIGSEQQVIEDNNFIGNVTNVWNDGEALPVVVNNYWDTFQGIDIDGDSFSELTYASSPFFMGLIQRKPSFQLFFGSNGIQFVEQLYQSDREQWLSDTAPRLEAISLETAEQGTSSLPMLLIWSPLLVLSIFIIIRSRRRNQ